MAGRKKAVDLMFGYSGFLCLGLHAALRIDARFSTPVSPKSNPFKNACLLGPFLTLDSFLLGSAFVLVAPGTGS